MAKQLQSGQPKPVLFGAYILSKKSDSKETSNASAQAPVTRASTKEAPSKKEGGPGSGSGHHTIGLPSAKTQSPKAVSKPASDTRNSPNKSYLSSLGIKMGGKKESAKINFTGKLREIDGQAGMQGNRFGVTLIKEGLGNFGDCFYYTADAIISAAQLYEGKKFFVDHPSETEEVDLPERSVNDIAGYFENLKAVKDADGVTCLAGELVMIPGPSFDRYRSLMAESIAFSQKHAGDDLVGLSINAEGDFDTMAIDQFLKQVPIPTACKDKVMEAMAKGITMIRPVSQMTNAFSCDLVTTAGAGGKVNQMLEKGKNKMGKQDHGKENEEHKEDGIGAAGADDSDGADGSGAGDSSGDHPDAAQDQELIMKMLRKYLGDGFSDDDKAMASEAYKQAQSMGMEGDEAMKCAGYNMKMAKHMQAQQAKSGGVPKQDKAPGDAPVDSAQQSESADGEQPEQKTKPKPVGGAGAVPGAQQHSEAEKQKESARGGNKMVEMAAEVARLRQELDGMKLKEHVETVLKESKLPMAATKKFRECIKGVRSVKEVSDKLAVFKEAFSMGGKADDGGWIYGAEKQGASTESSSGFGDCVEND